MNWTQTQPADLLIEYQDLGQHLALGPTADEDASLLETLIRTATSYAEKKMGRAFLQRTVTATYYANACPADLIYLPLVPVISITSVTPAGDSALDPSRYALEYIGNATARLRVDGGHCYPKNLTVVYEAGYANVDAAPPDLVHAVRMHAAYLYENRSGDGSPPAHLDAFYSLNSCEMGIG